MRGTNKIPFKIIKDMLEGLDYKDIKQVGICEYTAINPLDKDIRQFMQILDDNGKDIVLLSKFNRDYFKKAIGDFKEYTISAYMINLEINVDIKDYNIEGDIGQVIEHRGIKCEREEQTILNDDVKEKIKKEVENRIFEDIKEKISKKVKDKMHKRILNDLRSALDEFGNNCSEGEKKFKEDMVAALEEVEKELNIK